MAKLGISINADTAAAIKSLRQSPNFEFFSLILLSHKLQNQKTNQILGLSAQKLYVDAK